MVTVGRIGCRGCRIILPAGDYTKAPDVLLGGSGLVSTASDYVRFCQMMLNGVRLLGRKMVELMTINHLPDALLPQFILWGGVSYQIGGVYQTLVD